MANVAWQSSRVTPPVGAAYAADADEADDESSEAVVEDSTPSAPSSEGDAAVPAEEADESAIEPDASSGGVLIPPRPDWVESEPVLTDDTQLVAVSSGQYVHNQDCKRALDEKLEETVNAYIDRHLGHVCGDNFKASTFLNYEPGDIRGKLVKEIHQEEIETSVCRVHQMHALLAFTPEFRAELDGRCDEIDEHWRQLAAVGRLTGTALAVGFILALLGVVFGYFRLDTATRGYYTVRLRLASAVAILTLIVVGVLLARHIL